MSKLRCSICGTTWDAGAYRPACPNCTVQHWVSSPDMIKAKHDPTYLPSEPTTFRSVVPDELLKQPRLYYESIANNGTVLYSSKHRKYTYVAGIPEYMSPGSAIPRGSAMPTHPMDAFLVADALGSNPHIFAEDTTKIRSFLTNGEYQFLPQCSIAGCNNCAIPGTPFCAAHMNPPKAEVVDE
jgi:hypothetical protein